MFYIFYGDDDLSLREALDEMKRSIQPEELRDVNVATLQARGLGYAELAATCGTVPFMAEKRLVVLEGLLSTFESGFRAGSRSAPRQTEVGDWARLAELPDEMPPTTDLVTVDGPLRSNNPLLGLLRKLRGQVEVRTFSVPRGRALIQWVQSRAERYDATIDYDAASALTDSIGDNLRVMDMELQKLSLYCGDRAIRRIDVEDLVAYAKDANVFAAIDAVLEGRPGSAISSLHRLMESGSPASYIIIMIARQVRLLLLAKDLRAQGVAAGDMRQRLGLSGYPLRKTMEQERRFTLERLLWTHRRLLEADRTVKTTAVDEALLVEMLVADLTSPARAR